MYIHNIIRIGCYCILLLLLISNFSTLKVLFLLQVLYDSGSWGYLDICDVPAQHLWNDVVAEIDFVLLN